MQMGGPRSAVRDAGWRGRDGEGRPDRGREGEGWGRGFHDYELVVAVRRRGAHVLGRLPDHVKPDRMRRLADGSYLAKLFPYDGKRRRRGEHLLVRVIEYTLDDPQLPGYGTRDRLITTLLDPA